MKSKIKIFLVITCFVFFLSTIFFSGNAKAKDYNIEIENVNAELIEKQKGETPQTTFLYYKITVTLKNTGSEISENLSVVIIEDDKSENYPGTKTWNPGDDEPQIKLKPGVTHDFIFGENKDWIINGDREHTITIKVYPNHNETAAPLCSTTYKLNSQKNEDNSIPGLETTGLLIAVIFALIAYKKRKK